MEIIIIIMLSKIIIIKNNNTGLELEYNAIKKSSLKYGRERDGNYKISI